MWMSFIVNTFVLLLFRIGVFEYVWCSSVDCIFVACAFHKLYYVDLRCAPVCKFRDDLYPASLVSLGYQISLFPELEGPEII